jgi:hypothetical protein
MVRPAARRAAATPRERLDGFLDRFDPGVSRRARQALAKVRKLCPGAMELVYDNYNALAIGFAPSDRASEAIVSIAVFPRHPSLFFLQQGVSLPDPTKRLRGSGTRVRHIVIDDVAILDAPDVRRLFVIALERAKVPLDPKRKRSIVIKAVVAKQRPRRPAATGEGGSRGERGRRGRG